MEWEGGGCAVDICRASVCDPEQVCNPCERLLLQTTLEAYGCSQMTFIGIFA